MFSNEIVQDSRCSRSFETTSTGREGVVVSKFWKRRLVRPKKHKTPIPARILRQNMLLLVATQFLDPLKSRFHPLRSGS